MVEKMSELKKQILEKNLLLDSLGRERKPRMEKIQEVREELDKLLYIYYKSLRCKCSGLFAFWTL